VNNSAKTSNYPVQRKPDRRVHRTRNQLREALFSLVLEKGYESVTVEEITERADLGRTTFYLHYRDKDDLLMESIGELVDDLIDQMARLPFEEWRLESGDAITTASPAIVLPFEHVAKHANLYRIIMRGEGTYSVSRRLRQIIIQASDGLIHVLIEKEELIIRPQVPMDVFLNYLAGSWMGLVTWWLEHNNIPYTPQEMAVMFQKMFLLGARDVLGVIPK
jgi:AcrR family transcriptional regulator